MQFSGWDVCDCISVYIKLTDHQFNACKADQVIEKLAPFEEKKPVGSTINRKKHLWPGNT